MRSLLQRRQPQAIVHFAAESHVDRSILGPDPISSARMWMEPSRCWKKCALIGALWPSPSKKPSGFCTSPPTKCLARSAPSDAAFSENTPYAPNSPYAASKAASDHFVRAYHHTYGLPTLTTNCSNNYGRFQFPEKLIPLMILNAREGKPLPVYGDGQNVRDWLYVEDHCEAIATVLARGRVGETYNIGGWNEKRNLEIVETICDIVDEMAGSRREPRRTLLHL